MDYQLINKLYNNEDLSWDDIETNFPFTYKEIKDWNFSTDPLDNNHPYDLWLDDQKLYEFFDRLNIYVCPRPSKMSSKTWWVSVYVQNQEMFTPDECLDDRTQAEIYGFITAIAFLEERLKKLLP